MDLRVNNVSYNLIPVVAMKSKTDFNKHAKYKDLPETVRSLIWEAAHPGKADEATQNNQEQIKTQEQEK